MLGSFGNIKALWHIMPGMHYLLQACTLACTCAVLYSTALVAPLHKTSFKHCWQSFSRSHSCTAWVAPSLCSGCMPPP
jgi:hypothetical protein